MNLAATENKRKRLIQLIHVGKAELGMDDGAYRAFLDGACGRGSAAEMTVRQLERAVRAMRKNGFVQLASRVKPEEKGRAILEQLDYIKGMWQKCARNKSDKALAAFVKRIANVDALRFLDVGLAQKVILALRDMMAKAGFDPDTSEALNGQIQ
ncbi:MAG: regulatory protein GemA [Treponema sp.]|jgi:hypothetical protein|nr:regulatory protein GemA [Treponema sp.]